MRLALCWPDSSIDMLNTWTTLIGLRLKGRFKEWLDGWVAKVDNNFSRLGEFAKVDNGFG